MENQRFVVIVGKIGSGKSSTGNTLCGKEFFKSKRSLKSVTDFPESLSIKRGNKTYVFVDSPGFFNPEAKTTDVLNAVQEAVCLCRRVDVFLLVFNGASRLSDEEILLPLLLSVAIGQSCLKRIIVLFTHASDITADQDFQEFIKESEQLAQITKDCSGHVLKLDNKIRSNRDAADVENIFNSIESVSSYGNGPYTYTKSELSVHKEVFMKMFANQDEKLLDQLIKANRELKSILGTRWQDIALYSAIGLSVCTGMGTWAYGGYVVAPVVMGAVGSAMTAVAESALVASATSAITGLSLSQTAAYLGTFVGGAAFSNVFRRKDTATENSEEKKRETGEEKDRGANDE